MGTIKFELVDSNGATHQYVMTRHLGGEGSLLAMRIMGFCAESAISAMLALLGKAKGSIKDLIDNVNIEDVLADLDSEAMGPAVSRVLADPSAHRIARHDLMKYVHRDGKALAKETNFDQAFQGNYTEWYKLVWEVARRNRFLPLGSTS